MFCGTGPIIDCVVWHDGNHWRAALDTSEIESFEPKVAFADFIPMTNFKLERQYATFSAFDSVNYAVNIYEKGNILSIVTTQSSHGTHVAGIAAAYHPDDEILNGVAPGQHLNQIQCLGATSFSVFCCASWAHQTYNYSTAVGV